jgi:hypothetical protein
VDKLAVDTWHASVGCEGATWPNHGLPCGTPGLANDSYAKKFLGPGDSNPGPPTMPKSPPIPSCQHAIVRYLLYGRFGLYFSLKFGLVGRRPGRGLAPALGRVPYYITVGLYIARGVYKTPRFYVTVVYGYNCARGGYYNLHVQRLCYML